MSQGSCRGHARFLPGPRDYVRGPSGDLLFELRAGVHAEPGSATTEAVAFGAKLAAVTGLAVQHVLVQVAVGGVQHLIAHACREEGRGDG